MEKLEFRCTSKFEDDSKNETKVVREYSDDMDIFDVGEAFRDFLLGNGFSEEVISEILK